MVDMAERELQILQKLKHHQNIVQVIDCILEPDTCWIFMEFCNLGDLSVYLENNKPIDLLAKVKIMHQSASAVAFMHCKNPAIIHRDLKLQNILMTSQGGEDIVKLTDFGLSKVFRDKHTSSLSSLFEQKHIMTMVCGSDFFMAPELFAERAGKLHYDPSIDVFALGLVHMVALDYSEKYPVTTPLSIPSKHSKAMTKIGIEMLENYRRKEPLTSVVEHEQGDDEFIRRIKRIIKHMTQFRAVNRKNIQDVKEEYEELLQQMHKSQSRQDQGQKPDQKESRQGTKLNPKDVNKMRVDNTIRKLKDKFERESFDREIKEKNQEIERLKRLLEKQTPVSRSENKRATTAKQPTKQTVRSDSGHIQLSFLSDKRFSKRTHIDVKHPYGPLTMIDGQLWHGTDNEVDIYSTNLEKRITLKLTETGRVTSMTEVNDDMVAVSSCKGLFLIDKQGKKQLRITDGSYFDICSQNGYIYAIPDDTNEGYLIDVYPTKTRQKTFTFSIVSTGIRKPIMCVNNDSIFLVSKESDSIYKVSLEDKNDIVKYGQSCSKTGEFRLVYACMCDNDDNLLIVDLWNQRLQLLDGDQQSEIELQPPPSWPNDAVYDGYAIYVISDDPFQLLKYECVE